MHHINSLSDLAQCEIIRFGGIAEIVVDTINPHDYPDDPQHWFKTVRLIGFSTDANLTDMEIYEEGWNFYQGLGNEIERLKK